jgi:hypothetical protein
VDLEARVRRVWPIHCPPQVLLSVSSFGSCESSCVWDMDGHSGAISKVPPRQVAWKWSFCWSAHLWHQWLDFAVRGLAVLTCLTRFGICY